MKSPFLKCLGLAMAACLLTPFLTTSSRANSEIRDWKFTNGETFRAEIEKVDETAKTVLLHQEGGSDKLMPLDQLSTLDRAWILEWVELEEELQNMVTKFGGRIENYEGRGRLFTTGFHVYYPSGEIPAGTQRPLMVLFDPSGKAMRYLLRHMEAAETTKMTIVTCDVFRNETSDDEEKTRFGDVFPIIQATVPHDPKRLFLGGTSGGGERAFHLAANFPGTKWAGVYSNGGWLGGMNFWNLPYPAMRVAMVNGDKDKAANSWMDSDTEILHQHDATVAVIAFEGGHQIPPPSVQVKAFRWLLGEIE